MVKMAAWVLVAAMLQAKDRPKQGEGIEAGKPAPEWKLKSQDGKIEVESGKLKGRPVLLIFGSYT